MRYLKIILAVLLFAGFAAFKGFGPFSAQESVRAPASVEPEKKEEKLKLEQHTKVYRFLREIHAGFRGQKPLLNMELDGKVWLSKIEETVELEKFSVQFEMNAKGKPQTIQSSIPFYVEVKRDYTLGKILAPKPNSKEEEDELNLMKDFMSIYAFRSHEDTTGVYEFKYKTLGSTEGEKEKVRYETKGASKIRILSSHHHIDFEKSEMAVKKMKGYDETELEGEREVPFRTKAIYIISSVPSAPVPKQLALNRLFKMEEQSLQVKSQFNRKSHQDYSSLMKDFQNIQMLTKPQRMALFHELVKTLRANENNEVSDFKSKIEAKVKSEGFLKFGIGVMATVGSELSQKALRDWYQDYAVQRSDLPVGHLILNAFATSAVALTQESKSFLLEVASQRAFDSGMADNALFALGSALKKSPDNLVQEQLSQYYAQAKSSESRITVLDAMGNSGDAHFMPMVLNGIRSQNTNERSIAVFALRYMDPNLAAPLLTQAYHDQDAAVKQASIRAISFQKNLSPYAFVLKDCAKQGEQTCSSLLSKIQ